MIDTHRIKGIYYGVCGLDCISVYTPGSILT